MKKDKFIISFHKDNKCILELRCLLTSKARYFRRFDKNVIENVGLMYATKELLKEESYKNTVVLFIDANKNIVAEPKNAKIALQVKKEIREKIIGSIIKIKKEKIAKEEKQTISSSPPQDVSFITTIERERAQKVYPSTIKQNSTQECIQKEEQSPTENVKIIENESPEAPVKEEVIKEKIKIEESKPTDDKLDQTFNMVLENIQKQVEIKNNETNPESESKKLDIELKQKKLELINKWLEMNKDGNE